MVFVDQQVQFRLRAKMKAFAEWLGADGLVLAEMVAGKNNVMSCRRIGRRRGSGEEDVPAAPCLTDGSLFRSSGREGGVVL